MADMSWFYVVVILMNNAGWQSFSPDTQSMVPFVQTTKVQLAMPDEATCEAVRALNKAGECWAKTAEKKAADTTLCVPRMTPFDAPFNNSFGKPQCPW